MKTLFADLKIFFSLAFLSLFLLLLDSTGFLKLPKTILQTVTVPVQFGLYQTGVGFGRQFEFIILARKASLENKALRLQLGELLTENSSLRSQLKETESLVDQYNKLNPQTYDLLPSRVLGSSRYLTLDKGLNDGISVGQVVVYKDLYIGQIKQVSPKTSEVLLETDPDSKIASFTQGSQGRAKGILQGQFGSELLMDKILHQEEIAVGDLVYSEGTEGKLPKGLILGKISQVLERQNEVFKQAKVSPVFNIIDLDVVSIMRNP